MILDNGLEKTLDSLTSHPEDGVIMLLEDRFSYMVGPKGSRRFIPNGERRSERFVAVVSSEHLHALGNTMPYGFKLHGLIPDITVLDEFMLQLTKMWVSWRFAVDLASQQIANPDYLWLMPNAFEMPSQEVLRLGYENESLLPADIVESKARFQESFVDNLARTLRPEEVSWLTRLVGTNLKSSLYDYIRSAEYPPFFGVYDLDLSTMRTNFTTYHLAFHTAVLALNPYVYLWTVSNPNSEGVIAITEMMEGPRFAVLHKFGSLPTPLVKFLSG